LLLASSTSDIGHSSLHEFLASGRVVSLTEVNNLVPPALDVLRGQLTRLEQDPITPLPSQLGDIPGTHLVQLAILGAGIVAKECY
jgi:hypothetical protein